ncbi:MAG: hypothetical protein WKF96_01595 [Solirubrobacteraceae bacterium]
MCSTSAICRSATTSRARSKTIASIAIVAAALGLLVQTKVHVREPALVTAAALIGLIAFA